MHVKINFKNTFQGTLENDRGASLPLGQAEDGFLPYELLPGALGGCYYATFLGITKKQAIQFTKAEIEIFGEKRTEVPTTLAYVDFHFTVYGVEDEKEQKKLRRAAELAAKYCSVYQTLGGVADMRLHLSFK